jgi:hypothetical protein
MSAYVRLFRLVARHGCHGDDAPPIDWVAEPRTARLAAREGLILRPRGAALEAYAPEGAVADDDVTGDAVAEPLALDFWAMARDPALIAATEGLAGGAARLYALSLSADAPSAEAGPGDLTEEAAPSRALGLARISLGADARELRLEARFPAAALPWIYVVSGVPDDVAVTISDARGEVAFAETGAREMARGVRARLFRSDRPIPLSARPDPRFALMRDGPFGPRVAVRPLPAPALGALSLAEGALGASIHVNL